MGLADGGEVQILGAVAGTVQDVRVYQDSSAGGECAVLRTFA